ncbi:MAG: GAF domain-containing protein [Chloroflexi bacterium]|nr:GAF domain-containing protein [Chloroflexota bacterium]
MEDGSAGSTPQQRFWKMLVILGSAVTVVLFGNDQALPSSFWLPLAFLAFFICLLHLFPLSYVQSTWSLAHATVLGTAVLYGPLAAALAALGAVAAAAVAGRWLANRRELGRYNLTTRSLTGHAYEAGRLLLPLGLGVWLADWNNLAGAIPALGALAGLRFSVVYGLLHAALLLPEYALGLRPPIRNPQADLASLASVEALPIPFVVAAALSYPSLGLASLVFLAGIPTVLTILLNESNATRAHLERRQQDLTALSQISEMMRYSLELDSLLNAIQNQVGALMEVDNFYVALYDEPTGWLRYPRAVKRGELQEWPARPLLDRLTDRVVRERKPILLAQEAFKEMATLGVPVGDELIHAWLGVPLATPNRTLGCLAVYSLQPGAAFTLEDQKLLATLASQVSVALMNALLLEETQNRARQLEALNATSTVISASLNLNEVFAQITQAVSRVSRGQRSAVYLLSADGKALELAQAHGLSPAFQARHRNLTPSGGLSRALQTGQPALQRDLRTETQPDEYLRDLFAEGIHAFADLPLTAPEGRLGTLTVFYNEPQLFPPDETELLATFASQAALAVANARQYALTDQALASRSEQLRMLEIIGRQNSAALHSDDLFNLLLEYAIDFTDSPWGALIVHDPAEDRFEVKAQRGYRLENSHISGLQGIAGRVARTHQAEIVDDVSRDPDFLDLTGGETASQMTVPIIHEDRLLGIILLESPVPEEYTQSELGFVNQLADQAALAVLNADLHDQARRRLHEQAALNMMSNRLAGMQDLERVVDAIVQTISAALESHLAGIYLWDAVSERYLLQGQMMRSETKAGQLPGAIAPAQLALQPVQRLATGGLTVGHEQTAVAAALTLCAECQGLVLPLNQGEQTVGLVLAHVPAGWKIAADDLSLPRLMASQGALALQNARLFSDVRQGRDRLQAVLDAVGEGVLMVSAGGEISLANHPVEQLTGLRIEHLNGLRLTELPNDALEAFGFDAEDARRLLESGRGAVPKHNYSHHQRFLERTSAPVWGAGDETIGWVFVIRDVTEEHQINQARELITETLVHDLRSPIGTAQTTLELLRDASPEGEMDALTSQSLDIAERSLERVQTLITSLLDISRLEAGIMDLRLESTPLLPMVNDVLAELEGQAAEHDITIACRVPKNLPRLRMDTMLIRRVLTNLLDNALKFTPDGGRIEVSASKQPDGRTVACSVADSGPGVPPEFREEIFKRFGQIPGRRGRRRGTGLGLTFCQLAIEAHGGRIWVTAQPDGLGAVFTFTLPLAD